VRIFLEIKIKVIFKIANRSRICTYRALDFNRTVLIWTHFSITYRRKFIEILQLFYFQEVSRGVPYQGLYNSLDHSVHTENNTSKRSCKYFPPLFICEDHCIILPLILFGRENQDKGIIRSSVKITIKQTLILNSELYPVQNRSEPNVAGSELGVWSWAACDRILLRKDLICGKQSITFMSLVIHTSNYFIIAHVLMASNVVVTWFYSSYCIFVMSTFCNFEFESL
jgi:hypothetical protein